MNVKSLYKLLGIPITYKPYSDFPMIFPEGMQQELIRDKHGDNMNDELKLAHEFIKKQHEIFLKSNKIKSQDERLRWGHAVQTIGNIAYNYNITPKK